MKSHTAQKQGRRAEPARCTLESHRTTLSSRPPPPSARGQVERGGWEVVAQGEGDEIWALGRERNGGFRSWARTRALGELFAALVHLKSDSGAAEEGGRVAGEDGCAQGGTVWWVGRRDGMSFGLIHALRVAGGDDGSRCGVFLKLASQLSLSLFWGRGHGR
jgi:hypothetical protein